MASSQTANGTVNPGIGDKVSGSTVHVEYADVPVNGNSSQSSWPINKIVPGIPYGERLLPQVIDERAQSEPDRVVGRLAKSFNIADGFVELTMKQLAHAINFTAWWIEEQIGKNTTFETVAYMGVNDFRYWIMETAGMKMGNVTLVPSPRNSNANHISVLQNTNCKTMFYSSQMASRAAGIKAEYDVLQTFCIPELDEMLQGPAKPYPYSKTWDQAKSDRVIIVHTSGSTGAPKPIYYNHSFLASFDVHRFIPGRNGRPAHGIHTYGDPGTSFFTVFPFFHLAGLASSLAPLWHDSTLILPPLGVPANGEMVLDIMKEIDLSTLIGPPSIFEDLAGPFREDFVKYSEGKLKVIVFGGGPLAPATGDFLARRLFVTQGIGSTETGLLPNIVPPHKFWQYFEWHPTHAGTRLEPLEEGSDLYEMVIYRNPELVKFQPVFHTHPHLDVWRTKDLFTKHPDEDLWVFAGRRDDVIVLSNGEKFNPVTMEGLVQGHPKVSGALVVGMRKTQCALLLEVRGGEDEKQIIDEVWPAVEKANKVSPGHGHISKNMIAIINPPSDPDRRFLRAPKGTIVRWSTTTEYAEKIEALYKNLETAAPVVALPQLEDFAAMRAASIKKLVRDLVTLQMKDNTPADSEDLFEKGFDSLMTVQLVTNLRAVFKGQVHESRITPPLIYQNPSIEKVGARMQALMDSPATNGVNGHSADGDRVANMKTMLDKLVTNLPAKRVDFKSSSNEPLNVLVTGTTGFLGYFLIDALLADPKIGSIYCLNRAADAREKFATRFAGKLDRVEFLQAAFGKPSLGLSTSDHERLVEKVDVIIHNAWQVNFNIALQSFEAVHLRGLRNLIDWSLTAPRQPALYFTSSASTMAMWPFKHPGTSVPEKMAGPDEFDLAWPMGYGESKHVAERMLEIASRAGVRANIFRVGQIAGPTPQSKGVWTRAEWFPSLVKTSKSMKLLPQSLGPQTEIDWLPVDALAGVMVDIVRSTASAPSGSLGVFNLVSPRNSQLRPLLDTIAQAYGIETAPYEAWVHKLQSLDGTNAGNLDDYPALKLGDFYESLDRGEGAAMQTEQTQKASPTLAKLAPLSDEHVKGWLDSWAF